MKQMRDRAEAVRKTIERYRGRPCSFAAATDCGRVGAFALKSLGGLPVAMTRVGSYRSLPGAVKALRGLGAASLPELLDQRLTRIGFAQALPADLIALACDHPLGSLAVVTEPGARRAFACLAGGTWDVIAPKERRG